MHRLALCVLVCAAAGCLDWGSLYGQAASDAAPDTPALIDGCSDGTREGLASFPTIAACAGAWTVAGVVADIAPACARAAGNTGTNAAGTGCNTADLCSDGWHVCRSRDEIASHDGATACPQLASRSTEIYLTRQRGDRTTMQCAVGTSAMTDDAYGCGGLGIAVTTCGALDNKLALANNCPDPWHCGTNETEEGAVVTKSNAATGGGVLCCKN